MKIIIPLPNRFTGSYPLKIRSGFGGHWRYVRLLFGCFLLVGLSGWAESGGRATSRVDRTIVRITPGDDLAISAAVASLPERGGVVELLPGVFTISRPVVIDRDDVELRGHGAETVLFLEAKANCPMLIVGSAATPTHRVVRGVVVTNLVIDGNRLEQDFECYGGGCNERGQAVLRNNAISVRGAEDVLIQRVVTRWARSGGVVLEKHCRRVRIDGLNSHDNEFDGLAVYETEGSVFTGLKLHHNLAAGFSADWRFNRNEIRDSEFTLNGSQGIFMRDSVGNNFVRSVISDNGAQGIFLAETPEVPGSASRDNRFVGQLISGNQEHGIRLNDASCTGNILVSSVVSANGREDISLASPGLLTIER